MKTADVLKALRAQLDARRAYVKAQAAAVAASRASTEAASKAEEARWAYIKAGEATQIAIARAIEANV